MPALFSEGLMDPVCPPSTVYSAYNAWSGTKQIREYRDNAHEGGASFQVGNCNCVLVRCHCVPRRIPLVDAVSSGGDSSGQ